MSRSERRAPAPLHFTQRADAGAAFFNTNSNYNKELLEVIENRTEGHAALRGEGRNRTEKSPRYGGCGLRLGRENKSLRRARFPKPTHGNPCRLEEGKLGGEFSRSYVL